MASNTFSPTHLINKDEVFKKYWKESSDLELEDQVIDAYLAGVKKGMYQAEQQIVERVSELIHYSTEVILPFIEDLNSKTDLEVKLKLEGQNHLEFLFIIDEKFFKSQKAKLYERAIELESEADNSDLGYTYLIRFISSKHSDSDSIHNDGFFYSFVGK